MKTWTQEDLKALGDAYWDYFENEHGSEKIMQLLLDNEDFTQVNLFLIVDQLACIHWRLRDIVNHLGGER